MAWSVADLGGDNDPALATAPPDLGPGGGARPWDVNGEGPLYIGGKLNPHHPDYVMEKQRLEGNGQAYTLYDWGPSYPGDAKPGSETKPTTTAATPTASRSASEWQTLLGNIGVPQNVIDDIVKMFGTDPDTNRAVQSALAYLRGTTWYKDAFPGIQEGLIRGVFADERGYRQWRTQIDSVAQRFGVAPSPDQYAVWAAKGYTPDFLEKRYVGLSVAQIEGSDVRYALGAFDTTNANVASLDVNDQGDTGLESYGMQRAGINNQRGMNLVAAVEFTPPRGCQAA